MPKIVRLALALAIIVVFMSVVPTERWWVKIVGETIAQVAIFPIAIFVIWVLHKIAGPRDEAQILRDLRFRTQHSPPTWWM